MAKFRDATGSEWPIELDVATVRRVKADAEVDLLAVGDVEVLGKLIDDPCALAEVLWAIVEPVAQKRGIEPEEFARTLRGAAIAEASDALLEALVDFFPPRRARLLRAALDKLNRVIGLQEELAEAELSKLTDEQIRQQLKAALQTPGS